MNLLSLNIEQKKTNEENMLLKDNFRILQPMLSTFDDIFFIQNDDFSSDLDLVTSASCSEVKKHVKICNFVIQLCDEISCNSTFCSQLETLPSVGTCGYCVFVFLADSHTERERCSSAGSAWHSFSHTHIHSKKGFWLAVKFT